MGQVTSYGYDEVGNRIAQTDANSHTTSYAYDQLGRRISRTLPLGMSESYAYDADGDMTSKHDFNGHTTGYAYDSMNRLLTKTADPYFSTGACVLGACGATQVTYSYTPTGKRASMIDASGTTNYSYDTRDRLLSKGTPFGTLAYTYDAGSNVLSLKSSNSGGASMTYTYDALNRLASAQDASGTTTYSYDAVGNLSGYAYPNGVQTSYQYDTLNRLTSMQSTCATGPGCPTPGAPIASYAYTLGAAGNRLSVAELSGRTVNYGYDALYRLTSETIAGAATQNGTITYQYDPVGNRLKLTSTVAGIPSGLLNYDANDRLGTDQYDANGNTIVNSSIADTYDFENHLVQRGSVNVGYDGGGNRVSETVAGVTTNYLVADQNPTGYAQVVDELQSGAVTRSYTWGLDLISQRPTANGQGLSFYGFDGHGSVRFLTNSTAAITNTYDYDAFGNLIDSTGSTPNNYLFAGEQFDPALGIYYNRARYYDERRGRFWTMDTWEGDPQAPVSLHKYLYAGANPVDHLDPSGNQINDLVAAVAVYSSLIAISTLAIGVGIAYGTFHYLPKNAFIGKKPSAQIVGFQTTAGVSQFIPQGTPVSAALHYGLEFVSIGFGGEVLFPFSKRELWAYGYAVPFSVGITFGRKPTNVMTPINIFDKEITFAGYYGLAWEVNSAGDYSGPFFCSSYAPALYGPLPGGIPARADISVCASAPKPNGEPGAYSLTVADTSSGGTKLGASYTYYTDPFVYQF